MNKRISIIEYSNGQDMFGGNTLVIEKTTDIWAASKDRSGNGSFVNGEYVVLYDVVFKVRHQKGREINQSAFIRYGNKMYNIISVELLEEGKSMYEIIKCKTLSKSYKEIFS